MKPERRAFVVGGAHTDFLGRGHPRWVHPKAIVGQGANPTLEQLLHAASRDALVAAGAAADQVDRVVVSNFLGECFARQGHLSAMAVGAHPNLDGKPSLRVEGACASGGLAVATAVDALQAGADVVLVVGAEVETNVPGRDGVEYMAYAAHVEKQRHLAFALFPHLFARRARAYKEAFGATHADTARVVVKAYGNAGRNPLALKQACRVTLEEVLAPSDANRAFLEDADLAPHARTLECTDFTDGASALILASEAGLRRLGASAAACTEIVGIGVSVRDLAGEADPTALHNVAHAARMAWEAGGLGPEDVEVAEVHDCFAITELQAVEALGLCPLGEAGRLLRDGVTALGGRVPVNPGGGLLGFGHPIGATGVKQVVEVWRQATGRCGDYQMTRRPRVGVTANLGGDDRSAVVMVHRSAS
jgi:acetyl-CoA acyltransferase